MIKFILKRILQMALTLLILSYIIFFAAWIVRFGSVDTEAANGYTLLQGYFVYLRGLIFRSGDFGMFFRLGPNIYSEIAKRYALTLLLAVGGTIIAAVIGAILGIFSAAKHNKAVDKLIIVLSLLASSLPVFFLALLMMLMFTLRLNWLPSIASTSWKGYIMPIITIGLPAVGFVSGTTRAEMLEVINQEYIWSARARGTSEGKIMIHHAFRNTLIPIVTAVGVKFGEMLAGTVIVENAFSVPGLGRFMIDSITSGTLDIFTSGTCMLFLAGTFAVINIVIDLIYMAVDPRIQAKNMA